MTGTYKPDLEKASLEAYLSKPQKYARVEGERRFWLKSLPEDLDRDAFVRIIDRYIPGTRLRLRLIESPSGEPLAFKFGQKYRASHLESHQTLMTNIYLDEVEYRILARLGGATVIKRRYPYQHAGGIYSLDVFEGHLEGLILLEIESQGEADIASLPAPSIALREVTDDPFFSGGELAVVSKEAFEEWLNREGGD